MSAAAILNLLAAASGMIAAGFWFASAYKPSKPDTGAEVEILRGGTSPERSRSARLNRWAALFTGMAALMTAIAQLSPSK
jgi:hypothetical protein